MASPTKQTPISPRTAGRLNGLFKENEWYCNCSTRERAIRLQVKKDNHNRGRWFYKCSKPQQCNFFLWQEDAAPREREVVMANSHSETDPRTQTPTKNSFPQQTGLLTPQTERRIIDIPPHKSTAKSPSTPMSAKARMMAEDDEFSWDLDSDDNAELTQALASSQPAKESFISQPSFHEESYSPNKAPRTPKTPSPGKRKLSEYAYDHSFSSGGSSILATPNSSHSHSFSSRFPPSSAEVCMTPTPTKYRDGDVLSADSRPEVSDLAKNILAILGKHDAVISNAATDEVTSLVNIESKKYKGTIHVRDMLRKKVKMMEDEIRMLKEQNTNLKAQNELDQQMINSFRE